MTKLEELVSLAAEAPRPRGTHDEFVCTAAIAKECAGRYIKGDVLTIRFWRNGEPVFTQWWNGEYFAGQEAGKKVYRHKRLGDVSFYVTEKDRNRTYKRICTLTSEEGTVGKTAMQRIFQVIPKRRRPIGKPWYDVRSSIEAAETAKQDRDRAARREKDDAEMARLMRSMPELPEDIGVRARMACTEQCVIWFRNDGRRLQWVECERCGEAWYNDGVRLQHKNAEKCPKCGAVMAARNKNIGHSHLIDYRRYGILQDAPGGGFFRVFLAEFDHRMGRLDLRLLPREIYWFGTDGTIRKWKAGYNWRDGTHGWSRVNKFKLQGAARYIVNYATYGIAPFEENVAMEPGTDRRLLELLGIGWLWSEDTRRRGMRPTLSGALAIRQAMDRQPLLESVCKNGFAFDAGVQLENGDRDWLNMKAKRYFGDDGVFWLTRGEYKAIAPKDLSNIWNAQRWKKAGLQLTAKNLAAVRWVTDNPDSHMALAAEAGGVHKLNKYLRQLEARQTGKNAKSRDELYGDWKDYLRMAKKLGTDLRIHDNLFPLDLEQRHQKMLSMLRMLEGKEGAEKRAKALETRWPMEKVLKRITKKYAYAEDAYSIIVPATALDIIQDSTVLNHCVANSERYFERISTRESYIFFLRRTEEPEQPWYTLEVEPGGTIRQKRSWNNRQFDDLQDALPFLGRWQAQLQARLGLDDRKDAEAAQEKRLAEFAQLEKDGNLVWHGDEAGQRLVDVLRRDLIPVTTDRVSA